MTTIATLAGAPQKPRDATCLDHETRVGGADHRALRLWLRLLTCASLVETRVRSRLRDDFDCTLPRFDLLAQLDRHPDGLKMGELSRRMMVTGGNITGITDQLEADGWVERAGVDDDRRAWRVRLTPRGQEAFRRMAATHERWIVELFAPFGDRDQERLFGMLGGLKDTILLPTDEARPAPRRAPRTSKVEGRSATSRSTERGLTNAKESA